MSKPTAAERSGAPIIALGAVANLAQFVTTVITSLWISPLLVRGLGDSRYGAWTLVAQLTGYFGILDFGTRQAVGFFVAQYLARGDQAGANRIASTAFSTLLKVGAGILALSALLALLVPIVFHIPDVSPTDIRATALVLGAAMGIALPFDVFAACVAGSRRQHYVATAEMATRVVTTVFVALAVSRQAGLPTLALIQLAGRAVTWVTLLIAAYRTIPGLRVRPSQSDHATFQEIRSYGSNSFIINLTLVVINRLDTIVIGVFLGTSYITIYAIGQQLANYALNIITSVGTAFAPQFAYLAAREDRARTENLLLSGTRLVSLLSLAVVVGLIVFATPFIATWQQPRFVEGTWALRSDVILWILLAGLTPRLLQMISWHYLFTNRKVAFLARAQIAEAVANLVLSLILVQVLGLPGVALGSLIPLLVNHLIVIPRYTSEAAGIPLRRIAGAIAIPVGLAIVWLAIGLSIRWVAPIEGWWRLTWQIGLLGLIMGSTGLLFGLKREERSWLRARALGFVRSREPA